MARRLARRFENFKGVDYSRSPLTNQVENCLAAKNYQGGENASLIGRPGGQIIGQNIGPMSIHNYSYATANSGQTVEELVAVGEYLWRLKLASQAAGDALQINYVGAAPNWGYDMLLDAATATFKFRLYENGTVTQTIDVGTGHELGISVFCMSQLREAIDALANFNAPATFKWAKANGTQTAALINIDAGHNLAKGDVIFHNQSPSIFSGVANRWVANVVSATAAATVTALAGGTVIYDFNVLDNQYIGVGAVPAACIPIIEYTGSGSNYTTGGVLYVPFYYWDFVPFDWQGSTSLQKISPGNFYQALQGFDDAPALKSAPVFINQDDLCFFTLGSDQQTSYYGNNLGGGLAGSYYDPAVTGPFAPSSHTILWCYDSKNVYRAAPPIGAFGTSIVAGAGIAAGTRYYSFVPVMFDAYGVKHPGRAVKSAAVTNTGANHVEATIISSPLGVNSSGYLAKGAYVNGAQVIGAFPATLNVDDSTAGGIAPVDVGDYIYFAAVVATVTVLYRSLVTAVNRVAGNITIDPPIDTRDNVTTLAGFTFANNQPLSCGLAYEIYRTKAGGLEYYYVASLPNDLTGATQTYLDTTVTDALLGAKYIPVEVGQEDDAPPYCTIVTSHQGINVVAGDPLNPNTISWSKAEDHFSFPLASNSLDIPSSVEGAITALISDENTGLIVAKEHGIYIVEGDLVNGAVSIRNVSEGDYGFSSPTGVANVRGQIIGLTSIGIAAVRGGALSAIQGVPVNTKITGARKIHTKQTRVLNDHSNRRIVFWVPPYPDLDANLANLNTTRRIGLVMDYSGLEDAWYELDWSNFFLCPTGGVETFKSKFVWANAGDSAPADSSSASGFVYMSILPTDLTNPKYAYADNHKAIPYQYDTVWEQDGNPEIDKQFLRYRQYSIPGVNEDFVAFTSAITTYRNFQTSVSDSSFNLSFALATDFEQTMKLKAGKARALLVRSVTNTIHQRPFLTGYTLVLGQSYEDEDLLKQA